MTNEEIKQGIIERKANAFSMIHNMIRCREESGLRSVEDVKMVFDQEAKKIGEWISDNLEDEE
jgi:hypothetical protein